MFEVMRIEGSAHLSMGKTKIRPERETGHFSPREDFLYPIRVPRVSAANIYLGRSAIYIFGVRLR